MLTLVLLKLLSDLGIYYSFAGLFAMLAGADATRLLIIFLLQALAGFLTYPLRRKGALRFLPLVLLAAPFLLPGSGYVEWIAAVPPAVYVIYLVIKQLYLPEWVAQVDIFQIFWKGLLVFCAFALLMKCGEQLAAVTAPAGLTALACCVLLLRSLRHDASVYCAPRFQAMNLAALAGIMLGAAVLSSDVFLTAAWAVFVWIYQTICAPIIMGVIYLLLGIFRVILWLFSWVRFRKSDQQETSGVTLNTSGIEEFLGDTEGAGRNSGLFMQVLTALGLILAAVILFFVFRWFSRRARQVTEQTALEERTAVERKSGGRRVSLVSSPVEQVRAQYRKYLKLCRANGFAFEKSETSQEIASKTEAAMDAEDVRSLRRIYIAARYHETASKEDAAEAKRVCQRLAASVEKRKTDERKAAKGRER